MCLPFLSEGLMAGGERERARKGERAKEQKWEWQWKRHS